MSIIIVFILGIVIYFTYLWCMVKHGNIGLERDLKRLLFELEEYRDEYEDMKHQDDDKECEAIFYGKFQAYGYSAHELRNLLKWHGIKI